MPTEQDAFATRPGKPGQRGRLALTAALLLAAGGAWAEEPMSAIDWLSQSVAAPAGAVVAVPQGVPSSTNASPIPRPDPAAPPVTSSALPAAVAVSVLGAPSPDAVGLLPAQVTGLPRNLWGPGRTTEIAAAITAERADTLPALQGLLFTLLLAEADPPADAAGQGLLLLARIDKLLSYGALDQAAALIEAAGPTTSAELFRRAFDVALLTGEEDRACEAMQSAPHLAPTLPARIFCLARDGDWNAAALTLDTAKALSQVTPEEDALLSRFLDPELADGAAPLPAPSRPTPLIWRMLEAIGEPMPTVGLPVAFAHADLRPQAGWKAQIEAAERLARLGSIPANRLLGLYTERLPAASGGVWERVDAFQTVDNALTSGQTEALAVALPVAFALMAEAELEVPFAGVFAEKLLAAELSGTAGALAFRLALLSPGYETAALKRKPADQQEAFLIGLARGDLAGTTPQDSMARAIAPAFTTPQPDAEALALHADGRLGEALLLAIDRIGKGVQGEPRGVAEGLAFLRHVGLEDVARRTALELLLLERRG